MRILTFLLSAYFWQSIAIGSPTPPLKYQPTAEFADLSEALRRIEGVDENDAEVMSDEIFSLFNQLILTGRSQEGSYKDKAAFDRAVLDNRIFYEDKVNGTGRAELNLVDNIKFQRVLHSDSEISICFIPDEKVDPNSKHERRIIALQHLTAGLSRRDGQTGRDVIEVRYGRDDEGRAVTRSIRFFQRDVAWSKGWWRDQSLISLYAPNMSDILIAGAFWGSFQVGHTMLVNHWIESSHHTPQPQNIGQLIWTGCFGAVCGAFSTSIRKFNQIGGKLESLIRNSLTTTIPFLVPFVLMEYGRSFDTWQKLGVFMLVEIPLFCFLGNISKIPLQKIVKMRSDLQLSADKSFAGVKQSNWEYQTLYNGLVFPIRILFLKSNGGFQLKESIGFNIGYNKLALPLLYPFLWQIQVAYGEHIKAKSAKEDRLELEKSTVGATTAFLVGSLYDAAFIPKELVAKWLWPKTISPETTSKAEMKHLENFLNRWRLQSRAPLFHSGRAVHSIGRVLDPSPIDVEENKIDHRFKRVHPGEFPGPKHALISRAFFGSIDAVATSFRAAKKAANSISNEGLSNCAKGMRNLGLKMKAPFLQRLSRY